MRIILTLTFFCLLQLNSAYAGKFFMVKARLVSYNDTRIKVMLNGKTKYYPKDSLLKYEYFEIDKFLNKDVVLMSATNDMNDW